MSDGTSRIDGSRKTILVVDDEPDLCEILSFDLEQAGYQCILANGGKEAQKIFSSHAIDGVISDVNMPQGTGDELLRFVRMANPNLPFILFITGYSSLSIEQAYHSGADAIFTKPYNFPELSAALKKAFQPLDERWRTSTSTPRSITHKIQVETSNSDRTAASSLALLGRGGVFIPGADATSNQTVAVTALKTTAGTIRIGSTVEFSISPAGPLPAIHGMGIVRFIETDGTPGYGIEFLTLEEGCRKTVVDYLLRAQPLPFIPKPEKT